MSVQFSIELPCNATAGNNDSPNTFKQQMESTPAGAALRLFRMGHANSGDMSIHPRANTEVAYSDQTRSPREVSPSPAQKRHAHLPEERKNDVTVRGREKNKG